MSGASSGEVLIIAGDGVGGVRTVLPFHCDFFTVALSGAPNPTRRADRLRRSWSTFSCPVRDHRPFVTWRGMAPTFRRVAPRVVVRVANSSVGRAARIGAGLVLIAAGARAGGTMGGTLAMVGLVPLVAGALNRCVLGPLFHVPLPHIVTAGGDSR